MRYPFRAIRNVMIGDNPIDWSALYGRLFRQGIRAGATHSKREGVYVRADREAYWQSAIGSVCRMGASRQYRTGEDRVVFKDGRLAEGYAFGGEGVQRELLEKEGVRFVDADHVDMETCLWDPGFDDVGRPADIDWDREMGDV